MKHKPLNAIKQLLYSNKLVQVVFGGVLVHLRGGSWFHVRDARLKVPRSAVQKYSQASDGQIFKQLRSILWYLAE